MLTDVVHSFDLRLAPAKDEVLDLTCEATSIEVSHHGKTGPLLVRRSSTRKNDLPTGRMASPRNDAASTVPSNVSYRCFKLHWTFVDFEYAGSISFVDYDATMFAMVDSDMFQVSGTESRP